jgi:hypothetical protein
MQLTPESIDALVMQLRFAMEHAEEIPARVKRSGKRFLSDLDAWSTAIREGKELTDDEHITSDVKD